MAKRTLGNDVKRLGVRRPRQTEDGYLMEWCPDRGRYVYQHRLVIERELGRYLTRSEVVHHVNEVKDDNRRENLLLTTHAEHRRIHGFDYLRGPRPEKQKALVPCPVCGEMFKPKRRDRADTKTCSYSCSNKHRPRGCAT